MHLVGVCHLHPRRRRGSCWFRPGALWEEVAQTNEVHSLFKRDLCSGLETSVWTLETRCTNPHTLWTDVCSGIWFAKRHSSQGSRQRNPINAGVRGSRTRSPAEINSQAVSAAHHKYSVVASCCNTWRRLFFNALKPVSSAFFKCFL